jgi:hypothetical protein
MPAGSYSVAIPPSKIITQRMASRTAPRREIYDEPFWQTTAAKIMFAGILGIFSIWGIYKLEQINQRHQVELRLERDATMGPLLAKWREAIGRNQKTKASPGDQLPVALYFGQVLEYVESKPAFGLAPTCVVKLQSPQLLAGNAHPRDTRDKVEISYKVPVPKPKPQKGQDWLIAVWRDSQGNNIVHTGYHCPPPKPPLP